MRVWKITLDNDCGFSSSWSSGVVTGSVCLSLFLPQCHKMQSDLLVTLQDGLALFTSSQQLGCS